MGKSQKVLDRALIDAGQEGDLERARDLIQNGADVNAKDEDGWTTLWLASRNGLMDVVCLLIERGADINAKDGYGWTALWWAAENGHMDVVRFLIENGANVNVKDKHGWNALWWAAEKGQMDIVRFLTEHGADVNAKNKYGSTVLWWTAGNGYIDVVRFLTERGAGVNAKNEDSRTALMEAAKYDHMDVVHFLVERGADVNAKTMYGETALILAADKNHANIVRYLVANGASTSTRNRDGDTAIRIAARKGHQEVVRILAPLEKISQRQLSQRSSRVNTSPFSRLSSKTISPLEIELQQRIDEGNLGGDYRARWLDADVVVKLFVSDAPTSTFANEVWVWQQLRHPNVVKLYGACDDGILQLFVCEYASNGSLDEYLGSSNLERRTPWQYLYQVALGLEFLHERNIVHGDLRCRNILVGSDGLVKLANFGLSGTARTAASVNSTTMLEDSKRWQSPERLRGDEASFASDVYSLGMCIVEAVTGNAPWSYEDDYSVDCFKRNWRPEGDLEVDRNEPPGLEGDKLALVRRMCCQDPEKRMNTTSVVYELECLAAMENALAQGGLGHPTTDTAALTIDAFNNGEVTKRWGEIQNIFDEHENLSYLHQSLVDLRELYLHLETGKYRQTILRQFEGLLIDFHTVLKTLESTEQARILQLSATRTTTLSTHSFHRRIKVLWRMLNDSTHASQEREERWVQQRSRQIEFFVSEVSQTWLLLNELESAEQRSAFLDFLKHEMETSGSNYSEGQLAVIRKAYDEVASQVGPKPLAFSTPEWFIPWYELQLDQGSGCLGKGGFGSVYRAKWLDSDVVVKQVMPEASSSSSLVPSWMSRSQTTVETPSRVDPFEKAKRAETREMFKREADIWFGLSHPHVVRLFGACHVGPPFFVCEFATNGTLVSYLRQHPNELWRLLHEAALGVQYLHERNIVHGDLKGNNIVIGSDKKAKVTDFGLSSIVSVSDESSAQITGAWHWVAPECILGKGIRPTFASDVFSLGMCIIETLRVVESLQHGSDSPASRLPWGNLDNADVKGRLYGGNLPTRPTCCSDQEWSLVTRMCCHDPVKRLNISTVVDKLAHLSPIEADESLSEVMIFDVKPVVESKQLPEVLSAMKNLTKKLRGNVVTRLSRKLKKSLLSQVDGRVEIWYLYLSLWKRIELVHAHIVASQELGHQDEKLCLIIVEDARVRTLELPGLSHTLREMTEAALNGYALHRRLDKFISANLVCSSATKWSSFHSWQKAAKFHFRDLWTGKLTK
jgi:ankyrin repeat protein/tRNA A-37 threonylcarbamoyl transferase component Bud32